MVEEIAAGGAGAISIALDNINNKIYWFEDGALSIQRANKDGTGVETFLVGPGYSYSIVIPQDAEGTLPLRLVSFTANPGPGGVLLQWSTAEEVNTAFFGIERAFNGGEFITIGNLNANASEGRYHFADTRVTAKGAYHYRLKMIDKDGKFKYSPTVPVQYGGQTAGDYFLYPNPAVGSFIYLKAPANAASDLPVRILDITGKSWYQHTVSPVNGRYDIPVGSLPAGSYLLMIKPENEGNWKTLKFSK